MSNTTPNVPQIRHERTIDMSSLGSRLWVVEVTYSPDGRFLGLIMADIAKTEIVVWDLEKDRLQARIAPPGNFGLAPHTHLRWNPDGKSIAVGNAGPPDYPMQIWDPMTGAIVKELIVDRQCSRISFNRDGSKCLVMTTLFRKPYNIQGFRIYDSNSWTFDDFDAEGLYVLAVTWALGNLVLVAGNWTRGSAGSSWSKELSATGIELKLFDAVARLIDPSGSLPPKTVMLSPSVPPTVANGFPVPTFDVNDPVSDRTESRISLAVGSIFDVKTMQNWVYSKGDEILTGIIPSETQAFSPDGRYLYLKGAAKQGSGRGGSNAVLDTETGEIVTRFVGGDAGLAVRPDGRQIAIGGGYASVELLSV